MKFKLDDITKEQMMIIMGCGLVVLFMITIIQSYLITQYEIISKDLGISVMNSLSININHSTCEELDQLMAYTSNEQEPSRITIAIDERVKQEINERC